MKVGKELVDDPEYQKRLAEGYFNSKKIEIKDVHNRRNAMISVLIFILATAFIVFFGSFDGMRPTFLIDGETVTPACLPLSKSSCFRQLRLSC